MQPKFNIGRGKICLAISSLPTILLLLLLIIVCGSVNCEKANQNRNVNESAGQRLKQTGSKITSNYDKKINAAKTKQIPETIGSNHYGITTSNNTKTATLETNDSSMQSSKLFDPINFFNDLEQNQNGHQDAKHIIAQPKQIESVSKSNQQLNDKNKRISQTFEDNQHRTISDRTKTATLAINDSSMQSSKLFDPINFFNDLKQNQNGHQDAKHIIAQPKQIESTIKSNQQLNNETKRIPQTFEGNQHRTISDRTKTATLAINDSSIQSSKLFDPINFFNDLEQNKNGHQDAKHIIAQRKQIESTIKSNQQLNNETKRIPQTFEGNQYRATSDRTKTATHAISDSSIQSSKLFDPINFFNDFIDGLEQNHNNHKNAQHIMSQPKRIKSTIETNYYQQLNNEAKQNKSTIESNNHQQLNNEAKPIGTKMTSNNYQQFSEKTKQIPQTFERTISDSTKTAMLKINDSSMRSSDHFDQKNSFNDTKQNQIIQNGQQIINQPKQIESKIETNYYQQLNNEAKQNKSTIESNNHQQLNNEAKQIGTKMTSNNYQQFNLETKQIPQTFERTISDTKNTAILNTNESSMQSSKHFDQLNFVNGLEQNHNHKNAQHIINQPKQIETTIETNNYQQLNNDPKQIESKIETNNYQQLSQETKQIPQTIGSNHYGITTSNNTKTATQETNDSSMQSSKLFDPMNFFNDLEQNQNGHQDAKHIIAQPTQIESVSTSNQQLNDKNKRISQTFEDNQHRTISDITNTKILNTNESSMQSSKHFDQLNFVNGLEQNQMNQNAQQIIVQPKQMESQIIFNNYQQFNEETKQIPQTFEGNQYRAISDSAKRTILETNDSSMQSANRFDQINAWEQNQNNQNAQNIISQPKQTESTIESNYYQQLNNQPEQIESNYYQQLNSQPEQIESTIESNYYQQLNNQPEQIESNYYQQLINQPEQIESSYYQQLNSQPEQIESTIESNYYQQLINQPEQIESSYYQQLNSQPEQIESTIESNYYQQQNYEPKQIESNYYQQIDSQLINQPEQIESNYYQQLNNGSKQIESSYYQQRIDQPEQMESSYYQQLNSQLINQPEQIESNYDQQRINQPEQIESNYYQQLDSQLINQPEQIESNYYQQPINQPEQIESRHYQQLINQPEQIQTKITTNQYQQFNDGSKQIPQTIEGNQYRTISDSTKRAILETNDSSKQSSKLIDQLNHFNDMEQKQIIQNEQQIINNQPKQIKSKITINQYQQFNDESKQIPQTIEGNQHLTIWDSTKRAILEKKDSSMQSSKHFDQLNFASGLKQNQINQNAQHIISQPKQIETTIETNYYKQLNNDPKQIESKIETNNYQQFNQETKQIPQTFERTISGITNTKILNTNKSSMQSSKHLDQLNFVNGSEQNQMNKNAQNIISQSKQIESNYQQHINQPKQIESTIETKYYQTLNGKSKQIKSKIISSEYQQFSEGSKQIPQTFERTISERTKTAIVESNDSSKQSSKHIEQLNIINDLKQNQMNQNEQHIISITQPKQIISKFSTNQYQVISGTPTQIESTITSNQFQQLKTNEKQILPTIESNGNNKWIKTEQSKTTTITENGKVIKRTIERVESTDPNQPNHKVIEVRTKILMQSAHNVSHANEQNRPIAKVETSVVTERSDSTNQPIVTVTTHLYDTKIGSNMAKQKQKSISHAIDENSKAKSKNKPKIEMKNYAKHNRRNNYRNNHKHNHKHNKHVPMSSYMLKSSMPAVNTKKIKNSKINQFNYTTNTTTTNTNGAISIFSTPSTPSEKSTTEGWFSWIYGK